MPDFGLLTGTQERSYGGLPTLPLRNLFAETAITEPRQFVLRSRPQLFTASSVVADVTTYAVHNGIAIYDDGSGISPPDNVYVGSTAKGLMTVQGHVSMAGNEVGTIMNGGAEVKFWDGTILRDVTFPDGDDVLKVLASGGRFLFIPSIAGGERYYWTEPLTDMLDGSGDIVIDGLAFASAESEPDGLLDGVIWNGYVVLGGYNTIEMHAPSLDDNAPWTPVLGSVIKSGIYQTGCMTTWNGQFAWIDRDFNVCTSGGSGFQIVSNDGIREAIAAFGHRGPMLDNFRFEGHWFLRVRALPGSGSFSSADVPHLLLDAQSGEWCEWATDDAAFKGGPVVTSDFGVQELQFGAIDNGGLLEFDGSSAYETEPEHLFRFGLPISGGAIRLGNIALRCQTFDAATGTISLRTSRDKGSSWSAWRDLSFNGKIRQKIEWRANGTADSPGFLCEVKTAGLTEFSVSRAFFNEPMGGRSR